MDSILSAQNGASLDLVAVRAVDQHAMGTKRDVSSSYTPEELPLSRSERCRLADVGALALLQVLVLTSPAGVDLHNAPPAP
jgi:hypothetical protein